MNYIIRLCSDQQINVDRIFVFTIYISDKKLYNAYIPTVCIGKLLL